MQLSKNFHCILHSYSEFLDLKYAGLDLAIMDISDSLMKDSVKVSLGNNKMLQS